MTTSSKSPTVRFCFHVPSFWLKRRVRPRHIVLSNFCIQVYSHLLNDHFMLSLLSFSLSVSVYDLLNCTRHRSGSSDNKSSLSALEINSDSISLFQSSILFCLIVKHCEHVASNAMCICKSNRASFG